MWTDTTRKQFAREGLRLPSDLTNKEWSVLGPLLPARSRLGRPVRWLSPDRGRDAVFVVRQLAWADAASERRNVISCRAAQSLAAILLLKWKSVCRFLS